MINFTNKFCINGNVACGDKSISHRALICAAIAKGNSVIRNVSLCADVQNTAHCLRVLGADILFNGTTALVKPIKTPRTNVLLNCGNSGTTARLLAGLVAGLGVTATFVGDSSLAKRPMQRVLQPLAQLGATFDNPPNALFRCVGSKLVGCALQATVNSAQVKSAVVLAGLFADGVTTYKEVLPTRNHTEVMLSHLGAKVSVCNNAIYVQKSRPNGLDITVPNDPSSLAFLAGLGAFCGQKVTLDNVLYNEGRLGFYRALQSCGVTVTPSDVHFECGERVYNLTVQGHLRGSFFLSEQNAVDCIDEIPLLASLACLTKGTHIFEGVAELQHKECNRIQAILRVAKVCGQKATFDGANLTVSSDGNLPKYPHFDCFGDHRMAMSQAVICLASGGGSVNGQPFDVSFPNFLQSVGVNPLRFALIGCDISHSNSPKLMMHLAKNAGVCCSYDLCDLPADVDEETLLRAVKSYDGVNVTMPFKGRVGQLLGVNGAVNTVGKTIAPTCTDGYGVIGALADHGIDVTNQPLWVIGAGGSAQSALQALSDKNCKIQVLNRTQSRISDLAKTFALQRVDNPVGALSFVPRCPFEGAIDLPSSVKWLFVANYKDGNHLAEQARSRGITVVDGLAMLYHQGAKSFATWTDTPIQNNYENFKKEFFA